MVLTNPSLDVKINLPIWYHIHSDPSARKLYKTKTAKCLRKNHGIKLVKDALSFLDGVTNAHSSRINCACTLCKATQSAAKCPHPHDCINLAAALISKISPKWNPNTHPPVPTHPDNPDTPPDSGTVPKVNEAVTLKDVITIFNPPEPPPQTLATSPPQANPPPTDAPTHVYTDGACLNNGHENATHWGQELVFPSGKL